MLDFLNEGRRISPRRPLSLPSFVVDDWRASAAPPAMPALTRP
jgi:hypothetical protein